MSAQANTNPMRVEVTAPPAAIWLRQDDEAPTVLVQCGSGREGNANHLFVWRNEHKPKES